MDKLNLSKNEDIRFVNGRELFYYEISFFSDIKGKVFKSGLKLALPRSGPKNFKVATLDKFFLFYTTQGPYLVKFLGQASFRPLLQTHPILKIK